MNLVSVTVPLNDVANLDRTARPYVNVLTLALPLRHLQQLEPRDRLDVRGDLESLAYAIFGSTLNELPLPRTVDA